MLKCILLPKPRGRVFLQYDDLLYRLVRAALVAQVSGHRS